MFGKLLSVGKKQVPKEQASQLYSHQTERDLEQAAKFKRWHQDQPGDWVRFTWLALVPSLFVVFWTAVPLYLPFTFSAKQTSLTWLGLVPWFSYLVAAARNYRQFFAEFATGSRRRTRIRDLVACAYLSADRTETGGSRLPQYPMRKRAIKRGFLREGWEFEHLRDARRWAASAVVFDLALVTSVMVILAQALLFTFWSTGIIDSVHTISPGAALRAITNDIVHEILHSVPVLELTDVLSTARSALFVQNVLYGWILFALKVSVLIPVVSTLVSLFGSIRTFDPVDPIVDDPVVCATVTELARRDLRGHYSPESAMSEAEYERNVQADHFVFGIERSANDTAHKLNGQAVSTHDGRPWTYEDILSHVERVGVFA